MKKWFLLLVSSVFFVNALAATPLPANDVFQTSVNQLDPNTFMINWQIKPGYFLYSDRIHISAPQDSNVHLGDIRFPTPLKKTDHQGRTYTVYRDQLNLPIAVLGEHPGETLLNLSYQGCADDGFCYPPENATIKVGINNNLALMSTELISNDDSDVVAANPIHEDRFASVFTHHHWGMVLLSFFGFGLLLSFTPCVLPMVPVLSGIIVGHGSSLSTRKAFLLSLSYVLSMAVTYAIVGAIVARLGSNLQIIMQSPWAIGLFSFVFVLLALSMFGFFELKLPATWQNKLATISRSQSSGHYMSAAVMGCLSTLILSPCVTAPLIGALGYIASSGNVLLGSLSLFFLGLGMGTPLILIGTSAGRWLPEAGNWMNAVKAFFGVLLLAVAIFLLSRILPASLIMGLWAALLIFSGVYAGAFTPNHTNHGKFRQGFGIIMLVYGLLILIGASMGSSNPLQPLAVWSSKASMIERPVGQSIKTLNQLQKAIARANGKPIMLDFYADWCSSCLIMESTTFKDPGVLAALKQYVVLKIDVTANSAENKALLRKFNVIAPPTFLFLNKDGDELDQARVVGETSGTDFIKHLQQIKTLEKVDISPEKAV